MRRRHRCATRLLLAVVVAASAPVVTATACGESGSEEGSPVPTYGAGQDGETITANVGRRFAVALDENPTTGFVWTMRLDPGLTLVGDTYATPSPSPTPLLGSGGTHTWLVRVDRAGTFRMSGTHARPWQERASTTKRFVLVIRGR